MLLVGMLQRKYGIRVSHVYGHASADTAPEFGDRLGLANTLTDGGPAAVAELRDRVRRLSSTS